MLKIHPLLQGERRVVKRQLALTGSSAVASIIVSVAFQPVASISTSTSASRSESGSIREKERERPASPDSQRNIDEFSTFYKGKRNSNTWMHQAVNVSLLALRCFSVPSS